ncbi:hypothetical protein FBEOM_7782 [Fusarium beomiforme]|uniref:Uncharacterized protein n=1 Tax=Fusarium beomiforme TaxID=44412 RepID=A0A9P5AI25_9HYPO|nr:hypothetical protein FBEOM_7782 [Fusarium beomiforme]
MSDTISDLIHSFVNSQANSVQAKDPKLVSATLADNCRRFIAPVSFMKSMGLPDSVIQAGSSNELYEQNFAMQIPLIQQTSCKVHDTSFDPEKKKATVHLTHQIRLFGNEEEYSIENLIILDLDEKGEKIVKIVEFTDAVESKRYMAAVQQVMAAK